MKNMEWGWDMEQCLPQGTICESLAFPLGKLISLQISKKRKDTFYNISTELGVGSQKYCIH